MGSPLRLIVVGAENGAAGSAWAAVSDRIEQVEQSLSRFRSSSDVTSLNRHAGDAALVAVDGDLYRSLAAADRAMRITGGAFDPRVLVDLERLGYVGAALETPEDGSATVMARTGGSTATTATVVATAPAPGSSSDAPAPRLPVFPDGRWIHRDPWRRAVAVAAPVDLGGIGKGLALRWALAAARRAVPGLGDSVGALLEAGGDIVACGPAPQPGPWLVGIESPLADGAELAVIEVANGAVSTSSISVHSWRAPDGRSVHHLLDPATGEPGGAGLLSVTVAGPDPAWTEVWSKTLFLQGPGGIGARARAAGLAAWWVDGDGRLGMTPGGRMVTAWEQ